MKEVYCPECDRELGPQMLKCKRLKKDLCAYQTYSIKLPNNNLISLSLVLSGLAIIIYTYLSLSFEPADSVLLILLITVISIVLILVGLFALFVGLTTLLQRRKIIVAKNKKTYWQSDYFAQLELQTQVVRIESKMLLPLAVCKEIKNHSDVQFKDYLTLNALAVELIALNHTNRIELYAGELSKVVGQELDQADSGREVFLLLKEKTDEFKIKSPVYQVIESYYDNRQLNLPISLSEIIDYYLTKHSRQNFSQQFYLDNINDLSVTEVKKLKNFNLQVQLLISDLQETQMKKKLFSRLIDLQNLQAITFVVMIFGYLLLRYYLPMERAEYLIKQIDREQVIETYEDIKGRATDRSEIAKDWVERKFNKLTDK